MNIPFVRKIQWLFIPAVAGGVIYLFHGLLSLYFLGLDFSYIYLYHLLPFSELFAQPYIQGLKGAAFQPVADLVLFAQAAIFQGTAWHYHLMNLVLHGLCASFLFRAARPVAGAWAAGAAVLLFAWHPLLLSVFVSTSGGLQGSLLLLFTLVGLDLFALFRQRGGATKLWLSALFMGLAMAAGDWIILPLVLIFYDLCLPAPEPGRRKGVLHHLPCWLALALFVVARKILLGAFPDMSTFPDLLHNTGSLVLSFLMCVDLACPCEEGMLGALISGGCWILPAGLVAGILIHGKEEGGKYITALVLLFLLFTASALPFSADRILEQGTGHNLYLPLAFFCVWAGRVAAGRGAPFSGLRRFAPAVAIGASTLYFGLFTHLAAPHELRAGIQTREIQQQMITMAQTLEMKYPVIFFQNPPPAFALPRSLADRSGPGFTSAFSALHLALSEPFHTGRIRCYPLMEADHLMQSNVPFMLDMWGDGILLHVNEDTGKVEEVTLDRPKSEILLEYWVRYGEGKLMALLPVRVPDKGVKMYVRPDGIPVLFLGKKASLYRVVLLTQLGPLTLWWDKLEKGDTRKELGKNYKSIRMDGKIIRDAISYFKWEPVYLWVELEDEQGEVFHRSELIRFSLIRED